MDKSSKAVVFLKYLRDSVNFKKDSPSLHKSLCEKLVETGFLSRDGALPNRYYIVCPGLCVGKNAIGITNNPMRGRDSKMISDSLPLHEVRSMKYDPMNDDYLFPSSTIELSFDDLDYWNEEFFDENYWDFTEIGNYVTINVPVGILDLNPEGTRNLAALILGIAKRYLLYFCNEGERVVVTERLFSCIEALIPENLIGINKEYNEYKRDAIVQCIEMTVIYCTRKTMYYFDKYRRPFDLSYDDFPAVFIRGLLEKYYLMIPIIRVEDKCLPVLGEQFGEFSFYESDMIEPFRQRKGTCNVDYFRNEFQSFLNSLKPDNLSILYSLVATEDDEQDLERFKSVLLALTDPVDYSFTFENGKTWNDYKAKLLFFSEEYKQDIKKAGRETIEPVLRKYKFFGDDEFDDQLSLLIDLLREQFGAMTEAEFNSRYNYFENGVWKWFHNYINHINYNFSLRDKYNHHRIYYESEKQYKDEYGYFFDISRDLIICKMESIFDEYLKNKARTYVFTDEQSRILVYDFFDSANQLAESKGITLNDRNTEFQMIVKNKKLVHMIAFSQCIYKEFHEKGKKLDSIEGDFTFLVCGLIKAVERYYREIWLKDPKMQNGSVRLEGVDYYKRKGTDADDLVCFNNYDKKIEKRPMLGTLAHAVSLIINKGILCKYNSEFNREFVQEVRNGHLHVDMIKTLGEAEDIHMKCAFYFRKSIDDIGFTLPG